MTGVPSLQITASTARALVRAAERRGQTVEETLRALLGLHRGVGEPGSTIVSGDPQGAWSRVEQFAGARFATRSRRAFTYRVENGYVLPSTSDVRIPRSQFFKAVGMWPAQGPSRLRGVFAPSYVWGILADDRILGLPERTAGPRRAPAPSAPARTVPAATRTETTAEPRRAPRLPRFWRRDS